jgi:hypothetical protein
MPESLETDPDLDRFKGVNDECGHVAGDSMLREVAALIKDAVRDSDTVGRLGGDEFGILLAGCPLEKARQIADDVVRAVSDHRFVWKDKIFSIGVSVGLVEITGESASFIQSFAKIGLAPDTAGTFFLPRAIGLPMATALMMTGEKITAQRAAELGMIYRVVPDASLDTESSAVLNRLANNSPTAFALTKQLFTELDGMSFHDGILLGARVNALPRPTPDFRKRIEEFLK